MNLFRKKLIIKYYYPLKKEDAEGMFKKFLTIFLNTFYPFLKQCLMLKQKNLYLI
jgi:hypothetical protein